jgi:hypothetical protein
MILRLAVRSLTVRPLRTAVLAIGFGLAIAVMAELLGVGEVILEQAHAPALAGGGDIVVTGVFGPLETARFVMSSVLGSDRFRTRVRAASPSRTSTLYLLRDGASLPVSVRGGIPSREGAVGDPEVDRQPSWMDTADDERWINPEPGEILRAMDRFHPVPFDSRAIDALAHDRPARTEPPSFDETSWAEWLYFNGRSSDGSLRFYLTFLAAGPRDRSGTRPIFVRLQLNRGGTTTNYSAAGDADGQELLEHAPDLDVAGNRVRLAADGTYRITLALARESPRQSGQAGQSLIPNPQSLVLGELALTPAPGRSIPPVEIHGARGWVSGYVVPVLSGTFAGGLRVDGEALSLDGVAGYHDHNWGFWEGVQWQWGQVAGAGLSIVYGRVFPPADVVDRDRVPGILGVLGPDGPIAFSTNVTIREEDSDGAPRTIVIESRDRRLPLTLQFTVAESVRTPMALTRGPGATMMFLQLGGEYRVTGRAGDVNVNFTARGSAETFRPAIPSPPGPL